jgi:copper resistance protein C
VTVVPPVRGGPRASGPPASTTPRVWVLMLAVILVGCVLGQIVGPAPASAHNSLVSSSPADGTDLARAPAAVTLTFDQPVGRRFGVVAVTDPEGEQVQSGPIRVSGAKATQRLRPLSQPGTYQVAWRVVSADGHPITGTFGFRLRRDAEGLASSTKPATTKSPAGTPEGAESAPATPTATGTAGDTATGTGAPSTRADDVNGGSRWPIIVGGMALIPVVAVGLVLALRRRPRAATAQDEE